MITILTTTTADAVLAKTLTREAGGWRKTDYAAAYRYDVAEHTVESITDLSDVLSLLEGYGRSCVIRGRLKPDMRPTGVLRRIYPDAVTGEPAYFEAAPAQWLCCDFDHAVAPSADMTNAERLEHLVSTLPAYFHRASYHYQWSSSAGLAGWEVLKCHLWFWLSRPITDADLKLIATHQQWPCDKALMSAVQVHYTAAPVFTNASDPLEGERSGLVIKDRDAVVIPKHLAPLIRQAEIEANDVVRRERDGDGEAKPSDRLEEILATIGPDYHEPITKAISHYIASTPVDRVDTAWLKDKLRDAIAGAIAGVRPKSDYTSEHYLDRSIKGAIRKFTRFDITRTDYHQAKQQIRRLRKKK